MADYRIDELARRAGTSVRNVRVYQDRGLLAPPRRQGRVGWYGDDHLDRLRLIGRMLDRGYTFATIRELLDAWAAGVGVGALLGLDEAGGDPWTEEQPGRVTTAALRRRFGRHADEAFVTEAVRLGLLEPDGRHFRVPSPRLLDAGAALVAAGVPLPAVLGVAAALRTQLDQVADLLFDVVAANPGAGPGDPEHVAETVARLRPHAVQAVEAALGLALRDRADALLGGPHARQDAATPA